MLLIFFKVASFFICAYCYNVVYYKDKNNEVNNMLSNRINSNISFTASSRIITIKSGTGKRFTTKPAKFAIGMVSDLNSVQAELNRLGAFWDEQTAGIERQREFLDKMEQRRTEDLGK